MRSFYNAIYLSPHLDDVVLSCGGQIYQLTQAGGSALIVSIMAGDAPSIGLSAFAQGLHQRWRLTRDATAERRREDEAASEIVGADCYHMDLLDCIYRRDPVSGLALYSSEESLFGDLQPAEQHLAVTLANELANLPNSDCVLAPLTVGRHVDHQLTRLAAEIWTGDKGLAYYEEFPYVLSDNTLPAEMAHSSQWQSSVIGLSTEALAARIEAIACYQSQLSTFFRDQEDLTRTVTHYVHEVGGERLWQHIARKANCPIGSLPI